MYKVSQKLYSYNEICKKKLGVILHKLSLFDKHVVAKVTTG